jgi:hypothetical protein
MKDMTSGAWAFMAISWAILICLNGFCFGTTLRRGKKE